MPVPPRDAWADALTAMNQYYGRTTIEVLQEGDGVTSFGKGYLSLENWRKLHPEHDRASGVNFLETRFRDGQMQTVMEIEWFDDALLRQVTKVPVRVTVQQLPHN